MRSVGRCSAFRFHPSNASQASSIIDKQDILASVHAYVVLRGCCTSNVVASSVAISREALLFIYLPFSSDDFRRNSLSTQLFIVRLLIEFEPICETRSELKSVGRYY